MQQKNVIVTYKPPRFRNTALTQSIIHSQYNFINFLSCVSPRILRAAPQSNLLKAQPQRAPAASLIHLKVLKKIAMSAAPSRTYCRVLWRHLLYLILPKRAQKRGQQELLSYSPKHVSLPCHSLFLPPVFFFQGE